MGGILFILGIEPIAGGAGDAPSGVTNGATNGATSDASAAPTGDATALRAAIWDYATDIMYRQLGRPGNRDVLFYAGDEFRERAKDAVMPDELHFTFMDCAGCCNRSMDASYHWLETAFALDRPTFDRIAERHGYRLKSAAPSLASLVRKGSDPVFMHVDSALWAVSRRLPGRPLEDLSGDDASLRVADLSEKDRAVAERISLTGRCHCELCSYARKKVKPKKPRGQKTEGPFDDKALDENVPKAEALLLTEGAKGLIDAAITDLKAWGDAEWAATPAGPPGLQALAGWLASEGAPIATIALTGALYYMDSRRLRGR